MFHNRYCAIEECPSCIGACGCGKGVDHHGPGHCPKHYTPEEKAFAEEAAAKIQTAIRKWEN